MRGILRAVKVRVKLELGDRVIDETLSAANADDLLVAVKGRVERELGWKGMFLKALSPIGFAQEAVRRLNGSLGTNYALPQTADEFLALGTDLGFVTPLEES